MFRKVFRSTLAISILSLSLAAIACVEEGNSVGVYPGAPDCCKGLELKPAPEGVYGSAGTCVKKSNCVEEGNSVGVYPGAPDCCKGLELEPPVPGVYGSAGTCVEIRNPPSINVNDSQILSKDPMPGIINLPSSGSSAAKQ